MVVRIKGEHLTLGTAQLFRDVGDRWTVGRTLQQFDRDGNPEWTIVGHDVEEFVSVVEDFGIEAAGPAAVRFVEAARKAPRFSAVDVAGVCGCGAKIQLVA